MPVNADEVLGSAAKKHGICLATLVAETAYWASPEWIRSENMGLFYPDRRRAKKGNGEQKGQRVGEIRLDDNTYANYALKRALGGGRGKWVGFEVCHIWPDSCYDERYHTHIANLVLLPRALAGLSDHDKAIQAALMYRSYQYYGWYPDGVKEPTKPRIYPDCWRKPEPMPV